MSESEKNQQALDDYLDNLVNDGSDNKSDITQKMDPIKDEQEVSVTPEEEEVFENAETEKELFFISEDDLSSYDKDIPLEKYVDLKRYGIGKGEEKKEDDNTKKVESESESKNIENESNGNEEEGGDEEEEENDEKKEGVSLDDLYGDASDDFLDGSDSDLEGYGNGGRSWQGVGYDELNSDKSDEDGDDDIFSGGDKKSFDELGKGKKKTFEPGKLNKNNMLIFICAFLGLIFVGFSFATRDKDKNKNGDNADDTVNINDYSPDFGNYKARGYKEPKEEISKEQQDAIDTINSFLDPTGKEKYVPEERNGQRGQSGSSYGGGNTYGGGNGSESGGYTSSSPSNSGGNSQVDEYQERVTSSLRKGINNREEYTYYPSQNQNGGNNYTTSYANGGTNASDGYFNQLGQVYSALGANRQSENTNAKTQSLRFSDAGKYDRNKEGGDAYSIPPNSIYPGYIIPAVLVSGINTDYPGDITARVTSNVYDSRTGSVLLIPSGSILRGSYSSSSIGISRIQIAWQTLIINRDGVDYMVNLGSMVGTDAKGYSGIGGSLNDHYFAYLKAAGLSALFTYINSSVYSVSKAQKNKVTAEMIDDAQEVGQSLTDKLLERALDIAPTVTVKGGTRINVDVNKTLTLMPYERDMPKKRYRR